MLLLSQMASPSMPPRESLDLEERLQTRFDLACDGLSFFARIHDPRACCRHPNQPISGCCLLRSGCTSPPLFQAFPAPAPCWLVDPKLSPSWRNTTPATKGTCTSGAPCPSSQLGWPLALSRRSTPQLPPPPPRPPRVHRRHTWTLGGGSSPPGSPKTTPSSED